MECVIVEFMLHNVDEEAYGVRVLMKGKVS